MSTIGLSYLPIKSSYGKLNRAGLKADWLFVLGWHQYPMDIHERVEETKKALGKEARGRIKETTGGRKETSGGRKEMRRGGWR